MGQLMVMLRMARLLRVLRLVRLVRSVPPLYTLIVGIVQAMQGMMWVLVLTLVVLYVFSLVAVKLIGHGLLFGGADEVPLELQGIFPNVPESMFVLFLAMNGSDERLRPLFALMPGSRLLFVLYMVLCSWAILSILTAVISDNMISVTESNKKEQKTEEDNRRNDLSTNQLRELLKKADVNSNGNIEKTEFSRLLNSGHAADELCEAAGRMNKEDLQNLFDCLADMQHGQPVPVDDFLEGLRNDREPVRRRETLQIEKKIAGMERALERIQLVLDRMPRVVADEVVPAAVETSPEPG